MKVYPIKLKKWFLWNIIIISIANSIKVKSNAIFNDQLYYLSEGTIANIWLVLPHPPASPAPIPLATLPCLLEAKFDLDYLIIADSWIVGISKGLVNIWWSLTYDSKSAWSYWIFSGSFSFFSLTIYLIIKCYLKFLVYVI
jgi:hypothetical protein